MRPKIPAMQFKTRQVILLLFFLTFCLKVYYLDKNPLQFDDTLYAEMIAEQAENPSFLPTYLGKWAPWKPGTYFFTYSLFLPITTQLFHSIDWIYKFPNLVFGLLNALVFYFIAKRFTNRDIALLAAFFFYSSYCVFYTESRLLMEAFSLTPILLSLLFYTDKNMEPKRRFLGAGGFALLACLTKIVISFMIIPLALAYVFQHERKILRNPLFLLSLAAPFLGMAIFSLALGEVGLAEDILVKDTGKFFFVFDYLGTIYENIAIGILYFATMFWIYLIISARALRSSWKEYLFFSAWLAASLVPILSGEPHHWYFYYVAPAVAFFAAVALAEKGKIDAFSLLMVLVIFGSSIAYIAFGGMLNYACDFECREVGTRMAGKENVLVIGAYSTSTQIVSYKILTERRDSGTYLDFGYVVIHGDVADAEGEGLSIPLNTIVADYNTEKYEFEEEDFASMFRTEKFLKKRTAITEFDYVVVSPSSAPLTDPRYELLQNGSCVAVYRRS